MWVTNMAGEDLLDKRRISRNLRRMTEDAFEQQMSTENMGIVERFKAEAIQTAAGVLVERVITPDAVGMLLNGDGTLVEGAGDAFYAEIEKLTKFYTDFLERLKNHPDRQAAVDRALHVVQHYDVLKKLHGPPDFARLAAGLMEPEGGSDQ